MRLEDVREGMRVRVVSSSINRAFGETAVVRVVWSRGARIVFPTGVQVDVEPWEIEPANRETQER